MTTKYAVYSRLDNEQTLCELWNDQLKVWTSAVFPSNKAALIFAATMEDMFSKAGYTYNVVLVEINHVD